MLPDEVEPRLAAWLAEHLRTPIAAVALTRLDGGHSSGAWRVDVTSERAIGPLVLKAPDEPSVVHRRDVCREARLMDELSRMGAPIPAVVAIDSGAEAVGRPCFLMELVDGRSIQDTAPGSHHADPVLGAASETTQRAVWESFHDALAAVHRIDPTEVSAAVVHGPNGLRDVIAYWREALLERVPSGAPRQQDLLDRMEALRPPDADDAPAVCMGDARLVNGIIVGDGVRALVDFEIAYIGNPAADIGYSLFMDSLARAGADDVLPGVPSADETWKRWGAATGRRTGDRAYWIAFGGMVLAITATRAMVQWGLAGPSIDDENPIVGAWAALVEEAGAR